MNIEANVTKMFSAIDPSLVSGSRAELGADAGGITWRNAIEIARKRDAWILSDEEDACYGMRKWARETGAWDRDEIEAWTDDECIALFVQNVASEMRMLGSDDNDLVACASKCAETDWDKESEYPTGYYFAKDGAVHVEYYTGV